MKLPVIVLSFWLAALALFRAIVHYADSIELGLCVAALYFFGTFLLERSGYQCVALRNCALLRWLRTWFATPAPDMRRPHADKQTLWAIEPHGEACLGFASGFVPSNDGRTRVLAWSVFLYIPILRELYLLLGIVPATKDSALRWLALDHDLAVIPSGVRGLYGAVIDLWSYVTGDSAKRAVRIYKVNLGFCALAIKHKLQLVPVFVYNEERMFTKYQLSRAMPFFSTLVVWNGPSERVTPLVGQPIDAKRYETTEALADVFYDRMSELARVAGYEVELVDCTNERSRSKSA